MFKFFSKPYPHDPDTKRLIISIICIGIFIPSFLIVFEPFGLSTIPSSFKKYLSLTGFGAVTIVIAIFYHLASRKLLKKWHDENGWTTGKEIINVLGGILFLSIFNMLYVDSFFVKSFSFVQIPFWAGMTLLVGIIPVSFSVVLKYNRFKYLNQGTANEINEEINRQPANGKQKNIEAIPVLKFKSENEKEIFEINLNDLLFIESSDNYSTFYVLENANVKKQMLRGTLKKMEDAASHPSLFRCHRGYIINLEKVISVSGNAQGYRLNFSETEITVPVSRNLGKLLKEKLREEIKN